MFKRNALLILLVLLAGMGAQSAYSFAQETYPVQTFTVPGELLAGALSPDGQTLALHEIGLIHGDEMIDQYLPLRLLDLATGEETLLEGHTDYASSVAWLPDGSRLVSYHANGYILVWDVATQSIVKQIPAVTGYARIAAAPDGQTLAVLLPGTETLIALWDLETGHITHLLADRFDTYGAWRGQLDANPLYDRAIIPVFSADGHTLATPTLFERVQLWDVTTGASSILLDAEDALPRLGISSVAFTPDGSQLVAHDRLDDQLHVLDVATGADAVRPLETPLLIALSPDGTQLAWYAELEMVSAVVVADLAQLDAPNAIIPLPASRRLTRPNVPTLFFTPDGSQLVFIGFVNEEAGETEIYVIDLAG